jgi:D-2-hydroxyacid dehydrogenase (NADP+)
MTALVRLKSDTNSLDIGQDHFTGLEKEFPRIRFVFPGSRKEFTDLLPEADLVISWEFKAEWYGKAPGLKAVYTPAAGADWVEQDPSGRVPVFHGAFHGPLMSETLLGLILYFNSRYDILKENQSQHVWDRNAAGDKSLLSEQHVLIIGYGRIGSHCGKTLRSAGCSVTGLQRKNKDGVDQSTGVRYAAFSAINEELQKADHVVLLLPNTPETRHIITRDHLSCMKSGAFLYNLGRGSTVAEEDLVWALEQKVIAGAGLDVFEQEPLSPSSKLWDFPNVVILPHISAGYRAYGVLFVSELKTRLQQFLA